MKAPPLAYDIREHWFSALTVAGVIGWLVLVWVVAPVDMPGWFRCPFHTITGLYCPGCGSTRATHSLLHGRVLESLRFNFLVIVLGIPALVVVVGGAMGVRIAMPRLIARMGGILGWGVLVVICSFWVIRNIPHDACCALRPMGESGVHGQSGSVP